MRLSLLFCLLIGSSTLLAENFCMLEYKSQDMVTQFWGEAKYYLDCSHRSKRETFTKAWCLSKKCIKAFEKEIIEKELSPKAFQEVRPASYENEREWFFKIFSNHLSVNAEYRFAQRSAKRVKKSKFTAEYLIRPFGQYSRSNDYPVQSLNDYSKLDGIFARDSFVRAGKIRPYTHLSVEKYNDEIIIYKKSN
jgi:hypothetical protein